MELQLLLKVLEKIIKSTKYKCIDVDSLKKTIDIVTKKTLDDSQLVQLKSEVIHSGHFDFFREGSYYSKSRGSCHYVKGSYLCIKGVWRDSLDMKESRRWESWVRSDDEQKEWAGKG